MTGAGATGSSLQFDIAKVRNALQRIECQHTSHEGLYEAVIKDLQWIESLDEMTAHARTDFSLLVTLVGDPVSENFAARTREFIRNLSEFEVKAVELQITELLDLLESAARGD